MPPAASYPPELRGKVFLGSAAIAGSLLTRRQLSRPRWRRLFRDVYADAALPVDHLLFVRGAALRLPTGAVITGRSAAHVWGALVAAADDPVEIWSPTAFGPVKGLRVHISPVRRACVREYRDLPVCTPAHAAWEIARTSPLFVAVEWVDALARRRRLSCADLEAHCAAHVADRGRQRAATTLRLADPRAESPPESRVRVALAVGGLPPCVPQFVVCDADGYFIARLDLAWPVLRFGIEYDGQWHADRDQLTRDRHRLRALNRAGWVVFHVTRDDLRDLGRLVADIRDALARRAADLAR